MTPKIHTAQIIPFPVGPRAESVGAQPHTRNVTEKPPAAIIEYGHGWYHEAAIQDAAKARH